MNSSLTNREKEVLKFIVENFIRYGMPIGSRYISKNTALNLSPASIRNVMSDLEDKNLLHTPHTSAGRMPTDMGYRMYVDYLMEKENLKKNELGIIKEHIEDTRSTVYDSDDLFATTSKLLSKISHQLAVVTNPLLSAGKFEKIEVYSVTSNRVLVVISIKSGYVKTLLMEVDFELDMKKVERLINILNERLAGLTLLQIKETFDERINDYINEEPELLQLFFNSIERINDEETEGTKIHISGTGEVILQPEFDDPKNFKNIISLTENKNLVIHIFRNPAKMFKEVSISIGAENQEKQLFDYSVVYADYSMGDVKGKIGIIGPKRLNYAKMVSLVEYTSKLISELNQ